MIPVQVVNPAGQHILAATKAVNEAIDELSRAVLAADAGPPPGAGPKTKDAAYADAQVVSMRSSLVYLRDKLELHIVSDEEEQASESVIHGEPDDSAANGIKVIHLNADSLEHAQDILDKLLAGSPDAGGAGGPGGASSGPAMGAASPDGPRTMHELIATAFNTVIVNNQPLPPRDAKDLALGLLKVWSEQDA